MPGLVNCHGHSPMTLVRSAGDGLPLDRWLSESVWPREAKLTDEDVYWGMTLGAAELLGYGVTTTCEQYRHPSPVTEAVLAAGIRTTYTVAIFDFADAGPSNSWEAMLEGAAGSSTPPTGRKAGCRSASARTPPTPCRRKRSGPSPPRRRRATRSCRSISPRRRRSARSWPSATA